MELSNGLLPLATAGNRIVIADTGEPILLRGVNRSGLEYSEPDDTGFLSAAGISRAEIEFIVRRWKCNIIRLPFNQDWALNGRTGYGAVKYLEDLDRVIWWASYYGAYTLLDLHWLDADRVFGGSRNFVAPLPDCHSIKLWAMLAERYWDEPAVLYDLFNEPHDRLPDDPYLLAREDGSTYLISHRIVTKVEWRPWAYKLLETIRAVHPAALVFVSGTNWGYDLRGIPLGVGNVVYSNHVYPDKGSNWAQAFGNLAANLPVFAGEWGGGEEDCAWGRRLANYFDQLEIGWTAWSWSDDPFLVTHQTPTSFGEIVRKQLVS
jgi:endoglucanase